MKHPNLQKVAENESLSSDERGEYSGEEEIHEDEEDMSYNDEVNVHVYFAAMRKWHYDNLGYTEYLHAVCGLSSGKKNAWIRL